MISKLNTLLKMKYGEDWDDLEPETLSINLKAHLDPHSLDKICVLKTLHGRPHLFEESAHHFLRFVEVANGHVVDSEYLHIPTALELAWGLTELLRVSPELDTSRAIRVVCDYLLKEEGCSRSSSPFEFLDSEDAHKPEEEQAIAMYISAMDKTGGIV